MKKITISSLLVIVASMMLSGCIFPYWDDGYSDGGHRGGGHHDNGRHRGHDRD